MLRKEHQMQKARAATRWLLCIMMCIVITNAPWFSAYASSDSEYHSNLSDDEIEEIFSLNVSDIPNAWQWITDVETFVIIESRGDNYTYWWNVPNLQMTFYNMLYTNVMVSGYGNNAGIEVEGWETAPNALERYGFDIPSPTYMGERPLITISILGVLTPDNVFDGFGRVWNFIWTGDVISLPTDKDLDSLIYQMPRDYNTAGATFYNWVRENWYKAVGNIKENQILLAIADEDGMKDGKQWIAKNIIFDQGLAKPGLSADYICQELEEICGRYYGGVAEGILLSSGVEEVHRYQRIMPYDLTRMNSKDALNFNGVIDHRAQIQENLMSTGYGNIVKNSVSNWALGASSSLSKASVNINRISNLSFMEGIGLDPMQLWDSGIVHFLLFLMLLAFIFLAVRSAVKIIHGEASPFRIFLKIICTFVLVGFVWSVGMEPDRTYNQIKGASSFIFNMGNVSFNSTPQIQELYGTSDEAQKEDVNLWLPYFNVWTVYQTNHTILDATQQIDQSVGPEMDGLEVPQIAGMDQNLWSTVLADIVTKPESYSGNVYRMVDHFMAPRVELVDLQQVDFNVSVNENYTGDIQSSIHWAALPMQLLILIFLLVKMLLFLEFVFNLAFLVVNMALTVNDGKHVAKHVKGLFASMVNVAVANIAVTLAVWTSLLVDGPLCLIMVALYAFLAWQVLKTAVASNGPFSPKIFRKPVMLLRQLAARVTAPTGIRQHAEDPEGQENDGDGEKPEENDGQNDDDDLEGESNDQHEAEDGEEEVADNEEAQQEKSEQGDENGGGLQ